MAVVTWVKHNCELNGLSIGNPTSISWRLFWGKIAANECIKVLIRLLVAWQVGGRY